MEQRVLLARAEGTTAAGNPGALCVFVVVHAAIVVSRRLQFPVTLRPDSQHQADVPGGAGPCHGLSVTPKSILPPPTSTPPPSLEAYTAADAAFAEQQT